jgi:hypothetical protein
MQMPELQVEDNILNFRGKFEFEIEESKKELSKYLFISMVQINKMI